MPRKISLGELFTNDQLNEMSVAIDAKDYDKLLHFIEDHSDQLTEKGIEDPMMIFMQICYSYSIKKPQTYEASDS